MIREFYFIKPDTENNFENELKECILKLQRFTDENIVSFSIFVDAESEKQYNNRTLLIKDSVKKINLSQIPYSIISQPPIGHSIVIELFLSKDCNKIERKKWQDVNYSIITHQHGTGLVVSGITSESITNNFMEIAESSFSKLSSILKLEEFSQEHIVRQWNYIEDIVGIEIKEGQQLQNYQLFNEARNSFYNSQQFEKGYPAATGIGMNFGGLLIDIIAWKPKDKTRIYPINNPRQTASYQYGQKVLIGSTNENKLKSPPCFERGKLLCINGYSTLYVSGTASILGENTIGYNDIKVQTIVTLNNIEIIQLESIRKQNNNDSNINRIKHVRVYLKNKKDFHQIKEICNKTYKDTSIVYLLADVCRDDLLVEIEAEYGS